MPDAPSTSVLFPVQPRRLDAVSAFAEAVHQGHARRLWLGESLALESHQVFAALAARFPGLSMGTSVVVTPQRHPYQAALQARSVAALSGAPYVAGFGPAYPEVQRRLLPRRYESPLAAVEEYTSMVRALLDGEQVDRTGDYVTLRMGLPPLTAPPVELGLGVLRPAMARAAGRVADVAITLMTPQWYVRDDLAPALAAGAAEAGRRPPRIATIVHVAVARPGRRLERTALAGAKPHLMLPHYTDMFRRAGLDVDPGDPAAGAKELLRAGGFVAGTPQEIAATLQDYRACGVDEVILSPAGVLVTEGPEAALADVREVLAAVAGNAVSPGPR